MKDKNELTSEDKATNRRDESSQECIVWECTNGKHVDELKDTGSHNEYQVDVDELETNRCSLLV